MKNIFRKYGDFLEKRKNFVTITAGLFVLGIVIYRFFGDITSIIGMIFFAMVFFVTTVIDNNRTIDNLRKKLKITINEKQE